MRKGIIYIIKNKCNDKVYIGQTIQSAKERFAQHLKPSTVKRRGSYKIYNAIQKYGKENFYYEILKDNIDEEELDNYEIYFINKYNSYEKGYNSTRGGDSKTISKIQDIKLLLKLFEEKKSYSEIANVFNVNKITVERTLRSLGKTRNNKINKQFLIDNYYLTNKEIAKKLEVHPETVSRAFKKFGIKRGKGCNNYKLPQNQKQINNV